VTVGERLHSADGEYRMTMAPALAPPSEPAGAPDWRPRPWLAALLNVLLPGLGQLYVGRPGRAVGTFVAAQAVPAALIATTFVTLWAPVRVILLGAAIILFWPVLILDALRTARHAPARAPSRFQRWYVLTGVWVASAFLVQPWLLDAVKAHAVEAFRIPSGSMMPALMPGDYLFAVKRVHRPIRRGDAVVYRNEDGMSLMHRVVGLPGDTVAMRRFRLELNGIPVAEPYASVGDSTEYVASDFGWQRYYRPTPPAAGDPPASSGTWGPLIVPAGQLFLLGDRRDVSLDSRYIGFVSTDRVRGRPAWIYFSRDPENGRIRWSRVGRNVH